MADNKPQQQKRRIRIQFDLDYEPTKGKEIQGESETVPDMNLTVRQLLENHSRGVDGKVQIQKPLYFETEVPTIRDFTDLERYKNQLQNRMDEVQEFIKNEHDDLKASAAKTAEPVPAPEKEDQPS